MKNTMLPTMNLSSPARYLPTLAALALSLGFSACTVAPGLGRPQLMMMSQEDEAKLGLKTFASYKQQNKVSSNRSASALVRNVGQRIASAVDPREVPSANWEFVLFADNSANAFALPGGKVGVNAGLLPIAQGANGLATAISHEIAHVVARHGAEQASQKTLTQLGLGVLSAVVPEAQGVDTIAGVGTGLGLLKFSRSHELEADKLGAILMARAGYDPREAVAFWRRFAEYNRREGGGRSSEFLSTHPLDERRIQALEAFMPEALAHYRNR